MAAIWPGHRDYTPTLYEKCHGNFNDHRESSERREDLVNHLKAAGTIVTKKTIGNPLHREGLKSCSARKLPLLKKAHVQACLKFANDSEENWVKVLWSDETKI